MPTDTPHITAEQADALATDALPPADRPAVLAHAADCPACAAMLSAARAWDDQLLAALAVDPPPAGLEDRLVRRLRAADRPARWGVPRGRAAVAAAAVAVVGAGLIGSQLLAEFPHGLRSSTPPAGAGWAINDAGRPADYTHNRAYFLSSAGEPLSATNALAPASAAPRQTDWASSVGNGAVPGSIAADVPAVSGREKSGGRPRSPLPTAPTSGANNLVLGLNGGLPAADADGVADAGRDLGGVRLQGGKADPLAGAAVVATTPGPYRVGSDGHVNDASARYGGGSFRSFNPQVVTRNGVSNSSPGLSYFHGNTNGEFDPNTLQINGGDAGVAQAKRPRSTPVAGGPPNDPLDAGSDLPTIMPIVAGTVPPPADAPPTQPAPPFSHQHAVADGPAAPPADAAPPATRPAVDGRKVIRTGTMSFDVDRFDAAADTLAKVTAEAGGYVGTTESAKLPNGKMTGTITIRVPPERLDLLVLSLRALGDLKSQQILAQDVGKEYADLSAELTADRAMQERLLDLIRTGKGSIKDLLAAENELGNWRVKIERIEGQLRYFDAQVALSTLAVTLSERDIHQAATAVETETADVGVEADDVERARDAALRAIDDAHGRVVDAQLKRLDAGQFAATIVAEVPPESAGAAIDRLKQLGRVARLEVHRQQTAAGEATAAAPLRTDRRPTRITLSIYNLANVAPRRTTAVTLAAADPEAAYAAVLALADPGGRVVTSNLDRSATTSGTIVLEVPPARLEAAMAVLRGQGEVLKRTAIENPDAQNTTDAKLGLTVTIASLSAVSPRETVQSTLAAADVPTAYRAVAAAASAARGHARTAELNEQDRQHVSATVEVDVPRPALGDFDKAIAAAGDVVARSSAQSTDAENTVDTVVRVRLTLVAADQLPARETTTLAVEVTDADRAAADAQAIAVAAGGRVLTADVNRSPTGPATAKVVLDVPLARSADVTRDLRQLGTVRGVDAARDAAAPAGPLAHARIEIDFATADALVADQSGPWASFRQGLSTGLRGLLLSLQWIVVGLSLLVPWAIVAYVARRAWQRWRRPAVGP
jgi:hypothetical protein